MQLPQCDHKNHQPSLQLIYSNKGITSAPKRSLVNDSDIIWEVVPQLTIANQIDAKDLESSQAEQSVFTEDLKLGITDQAHD
ncbi:hypothetical protein J6590_057212 [Homalodisca vitripennis]|nr:hypothetical protein J6590_057212 [Homalodisca vitripennis]